MLPYIYLFHIEIPTYSLFIGIACIAALLCALMRRKINGLTMRDLVFLLIVSGIGFYFGAKLYMVFQYFPSFLRQYATEGLSFFTYYSQSGYAFYGGYFGALLAVALFHKINKLSFWQLVDSLIPSLLLFQGIAKIGCFLAGCCYGIVCAHGFVMSPLSPANPGVLPLFPVQLWESFSTLVLFIFLVIYGRVKRPAGRMFGYYSLGYGVIRFILEFFRYNPPAEYAGPFTVAQWCSIALILAGLYFSFIYRKKLNASCENTGSNRT